MEFLLFSVYENWRDVCWWTSSYPNFKSVALLFKFGFVFLSFLIEIAAILEKIKFIMTNETEKFEMHVKNTEPF